jgi:hypothetical protein
MQKISRENRQKVFLPVENVENTVTAGVPLWKTLNPVVLPLLTSSVKGLSLPHSHFSSTLNVQFISDFVQRSLKRESFSKPLKDAHLFRCFSARTRYRPKEPRVFHSFFPPFHVSIS